MKRGLELEPVAAVEYQDLTSFPCGFVIGEVIDPSASPMHGLLEIKCPNKGSMRLVLQG